jgi:hypothetical protein
VLASQKRGFEDVAPHRTGQENIVVIANHPQAKRVGHGKRQLDRSHQHIPADEREQRTDQAKHGGQCQVPPVDVAREDVLTPNLAEPSPVQDDYDSQQAECQDEFENGPKSLEEVAVWFAHEPALALKSGKRLHLHPLFYSSSR